MENLNIFKVKFEYDDGAYFRELGCFVVADSEETARKVFDENYRKIFRNYDDECKVIAVSRVSNDAKILYSQGGVFWEVGNFMGMW